MKRERLIRCVVVGALTIPLFLGGCGSSRFSKFYTLNPVKSAGTGGKQIPPSDTAVTLGIGPIEIPDYLDRPQIVTRTVQNEIDMAEFDRWAGSLKSDMTRVLVENFSVLLPAEKISVVPWNYGGPFRYRLALSVSRFDATPGENVWLKARWTIFDLEGKKVILSHESNLSEPLSGRDYAAVVAAMSRVLGSVSQDIANALKSILSIKAETPSSEKGG
jgi:uncharacterized protein